VEAVSPRVHSFELPYPPSVNHYWRRVGDATIISREGRRFRKEVFDLLAPRQGDRLEGRLAVRILACPPDARRRDLDNIMKALLDALEDGGVYRDDGQIDCLFVERGPIAPRGKVMVQVKEIES